MTKQHHTHTKLNDFEKSYIVANKDWHIEL